MQWMAWIVVALAGLATVGCRGGVRDAPAPVPPPPLDAPAKVPADVVVSTNEPFWQFSVSGETALLVGIDTRRPLRPTSNEVVLDGRVVTAADADGSIEARLAGRACQDSMSGAWFPYTARLTLADGTQASGCARGIDDPPPRP